MAEEFQGGVCGGNWWNSSKYLFSSSPCSSVMMNDNIGGDFGPWPSSQDSLNMIKSIRSSNDSAGSISDDNNSSVLQDIPKPTSHDWNQDFINNSGKSDENYSQFLQESVAMNSSMNYCEEFSLENQPLISQGLTTSFPLDSISYGYTSSLLQTLFGTNSQPADHLLLDNNQTMNYSSTANCLNSSDFSPSMPKASPMNKPINFQFTNNTPYWNATATNNNISASFLPSSIGKVNLPNFYPKKEIPKKIQNHNQEIGEMASQVVKKASNDQPAFKRQRIETPSPLPTFKVRKEKMGDRVTALQQLVSPFGKTDTASVLHEAIEYIKFLHDQVNVLSTPYLKNGSPPLQHPQANDNTKDQEGLKQDLKSRGLCLVPISSTFPVATETPHDFWTPTFGGSYR